MELYIDEVKSAGNIDNECLVLKCCSNNTDWPEKYMIFDQTYDSDGDVSNKIRHCYIFPERIKGEYDDAPTLHRWEDGDIIELHTRNGRNRVVANGNNKIYKYFWKLGNSVWNADGDEVTLLKIGDISTKSI